MTPSGHGESVTVTNYHCNRIFWCMNGHLGPVKTVTVSICHSKRCHCNRLCLYSFKVVDIFSKSYYLQSHITGCCPSLPSKVLREARVDHRVHARVDPAEPRHHLKSNWSLSISHSFLDSLTLAKKGWLTHRRAYSCKKLTWSTCQVNFSCSISRWSRGSYTF